MCAAVDDGFAIPGAGSRTVHGRHDVLGVVLAGGAGARVGGSDKGLLSLQGHPLIEHVLDSLRPQCARLLIVANRNLDAYASHAPTVHDETGERAGPLAGLATAFGFLAANLHALPRWLLTVPVDCPAPPRDLVARLRATLLADTSTCCAFARHAGRSEPLFALYRVGEDPRDMRTSAQAALHEHGSTWRWQAALAASAVDFDDAGLSFHNLNAPADFADYERTHGRT